MNRNQALYSLSCGLIGVIFLTLSFLPRGNAEEEMKDAFAPVVQPETVADTPSAVAAPATRRLEAISLGVGDGRVVIDGVIYHPGEIKNGLEIVQIRRGEVDIISNGISQTLRLYENDPASSAMLSSERGKTPVKTETAESSSRVNTQAVKPESMQDFLKDL